MILRQSIPRLAPGAALMDEADQCHERPILHKCASSQPRLDRAQMLLTPLLPSGITSPAICLNSCLTVSAADRNEGLDTRQDVGALAISCYPCFASTMSFTRREYYRTLYRRPSYLRCKSHRLGPVEVFETQMLVGRRKFASAK